MNIAARFPDTDQSRRFATLEAFDRARMEEQRARLAKDDLAKRIFRKDLPADSERLLDRLDRALALAVKQKRALLDRLLDTSDDLATEDDVTFEMRRSIRVLTAIEDADPDAEHRLGAADCLNRRASR